MQIWPKRGVLSTFRLALLVVLLIVSVIYVAIIIKFRYSKPGPPSGQFAEVFATRLYDAAFHQPNHPSANGTDGARRMGYILSLANQLSIASKCESILAETESSAKFEAEVQKCQSNEPQLDPWGRPYKVRAVKANLPMIQSTGPSGEDRVYGRELAIERPPKPVAWQMEGDNLIVLRYFDALEKTKSKIE